MQVHFEDVAVGDAIPALVKSCSPRQLVEWAAASGDFYEIHYDIDYARSIGLPTLLVHGALKHAFLGQLLHEWIQPLGRVVSFGCSYRGVDRPGEQITCRGVVTSTSARSDERLIGLDVWCENEAGQRTTPGTAVVSLPTRL